MPSLNCSKPPSSSSGLAEARGEQNCRREGGESDWHCWECAITARVWRWFFEQRGRGNVRAATQLRLWLA